MLRGLMATTIFSSLMAAAQEGVILPVTDFQCRGSYVRESYRLNNLYLEGDLAKEARDSLNQKDRRELKGYYIGAAAGFVGTMAVMKKNGHDAGDSVGVSLLGGVVGGGFTGISVANAFAGKSTKEKEKQAQKYLKELKASYDRIIAAIDLVVSSKLLTEKEKYTPDELAPHVSRVFHFIASNKLVVKIDDFVAKLMSVDSDMSLCANDMPLDTNGIAMLFRN